MLWFVPCLRRILGVSAVVATVFLTGITTQADEIRLKDGKKLYGVIVAYEDNMFKVKTDYGFVLVEKDKIASIVPDTPADGAEAKPAAKPTASEGNKQAKAAAIANNPAARPEIPLTVTKGDATPPSIKPVSATPKTALAAPAAAPLPPKEEPPPIREEVQGNLY